MAVLFKARSDFAFKTQEQLSGASTGIPVTSAEVNHLTMFAANTHVVLIDFGGSSRSRIQRVHLLHASYSAADALLPPKSGLEGRDVWHDGTYSVDDVSALHIVDNAFGSTRERERKSSIAVLSPRLFRYQPFGEYVEGLTYRGDRVAAPAERRMLASSTIKGPY
ncbi:MAG TPA: hypothetical protein DDW52_10920 [Planctomycetaceae bacterium]|nr:hypothetical protein [Planctomycetaceae bacterium]